MSALNADRNVQTVLLGNSLIQGVSRYAKVWNSFFGKNTLNCGIREDKVENLLWQAEKLEFPLAIRQIVIHCGKKIRQMIIQMVRFFYCIVL